MIRVSASLLLALVALAGGTGPAGEPPPGSGGGGHEAAPAPRPLPFFYDLYAFRGDTGSTAVVASFAVPAGQLHQENVDGRVRYRFNVTLVLADTALGGWSRADDSVFVAVPDALDGDHLIHTHVETSARPSATTVHRVVMIDAPYPGTGQLYTHPYVIPDFSGSQLMISDIALGLPGRGAGWKRRGATLALLPSSHFPGGLFDVYYEIYNLPRGNQYSTEISFQPVTESGVPAPGVERTIRVQFSGESAAGRDGVVSELRRVDAPLATGRHLLTVTVTDHATGRTSRRTRMLQVRDWEGGATLVPACPVAPGVERAGCGGESRATGGPAARPLPDRG